MGVLDTIRSWFGGAKPTMEQAAKAAELVGTVFGSPLATTEAQGLLAGIFPSGQPPKRGTKELMLVYAANPWLRSVVNQISERVSVTNWRTFAVRAAPGQQKAIRSIAFQRGAKTVRNQIRRKFTQTGQLDEIADHPMLDFLHGGNLMLDGRACLKVTQIHLDLKGEAYWLIERDEQGLPVRYWPLPPFWVYETPSVKRPFFRVTFGAWHGWIPETEMVWFRDVDPYNPYGRGIGLGEALGDTLDTDEYAAKHTKAWFYNSAMPASIITMKGGSGAKDEAKRLKEEWTQNYQGFWKAFRVHFTSNEIDVKQLDQSFKDNEILQLRQNFRDQILEVFGYPKELLGILTNSNRSTIETAAFRKEKYVIEPRREAIRHTLQQRLAKEWDERLVLDYDNEVPDDKETVLKIFQIRPSAFSENEVRELADFEPLDGPDGDARPPLGGAAPAAMDPFAPKSLKAAEDDEDKLTREQIDEAVGAVDASTLRNELTPVWEDNFQKFADQTMMDVGSSMSFDIRNDAVRRHLQQFGGHKIAEINDTTRQKVRDILVAGYDNGDSIDDIASELEDSAGFDEARAELIARTEVLGSSNFGQLEAYKQSGVVDQKEWIATPGTKGSRESHEELDGQKIGLEDYFVDSATGAKGQHPGGFGDPASDANCRCSILPVVDDQTGDGSDEDKAAHETRTKQARVEHYKAVTARREAWERDAQKAINRAFKKQLKAVLAKVRR